MDKDEALTIETPEILRRKYRFIRQIGEGANGITYLAVERVSGEKVAVKQLKKVDDFKSFDLFRREVETMKSVDIDGVPKYIDYIERKIAKVGCRLSYSFYALPLAFVYQRVVFPRLLQHKYAVPFLI